MSAYKHWVFAFEGIRGLAYVFAIVSIIAPSFLAFYLLSPQELLRMSWPTAALISASVGGITAVSAILAVVMGSHDQFPTEGHGLGIGEEEARSHLAAGPVCGLLDQVLALVYCLMFDLPFHDYVVTALVMALLGGVFLYLHASFSLRRERQKKKPPATD